MIENKFTLEQLCNEIEVNDDWLEKYKKFVPQFINEAKNKTDWQDWDKEVFKVFFEMQNNCVSSLAQGCFSYDEQENIKRNWEKLSPLLKIVADNQTEPQWNTYGQIKETIRKHTNRDKKAATNRLIAALQPDLLCTIIAEERLRDLFVLLPKYVSNNIPKWVDNNWFLNSYNILKFIQDELQPDNLMDIITYPWQILDSLRNLEKIINENQLQMKDWSDKLKTARNLILTGAPGTGKTYLAKQIAETMNAEIEFVQFHPSYDYTDFVEGLRPTPPDENGNIGFERKDGIFKKFCKKALLNESQVSNFDNIYETFIEDIIQNPQKFTTPMQKKTFFVEINSKKTCVAIPDTEKATRMAITKEMIRDYVENGNIRDWKPYTIAIGDYIKQNYRIENKSIKDENNKPFVFIIDEINRGEISKIFGELFFSIDPGYRGEKGKVGTQYANLIEDGDVFKDGFFIPENVYVIGTMNDIDRSVESFDFAMRRRFTWIEITYDESAKNMNLSEESKERMTSLNNAISNIEGLNSSYHIGAAYFLKLENDNYQKLWDYHLKSLLFEYLRGMPDAKNKLNILEKAYNLQSTPNENNGQ
jgi:Cdc6-like AAA superfamily ATPase